MQQVAYFISDAHLGIDPAGSIPDREAKLVELLNQWCGKVSHVVIVGDLFEFWYEYRYYVAKSHFPLLNALWNLRQSGTEVHLICGNHDFAYGNFFPEMLGIQVHKSLVLEIQGKRVFFQHGDGVAHSDSGYRFLRKILDFPLNRFLFRQLHPDWGMALARFVGRNSRKIGESRVIRLEEYLEWGNQALAQEKCQYCIHGHHHLSGIWKVDNGVVASPGEWIWKPSYLQMENGELSLKSLEN